MAIIVFFGMMLAIGYAWSGVRRVVKTVRCRYLWEEMERKNKFINEQKMRGDEKVNDGGRSIFSISSLRFLSLWLFRSLLFQESSDV